MDKAHAKSRRRVGDLLVLTFVIVVMVLLGIELRRSLASFLAEPAPLAPASSQDGP